VLTALLPVSLVPAVLLYLPSEWYALGVLVPVLVLLPVAVALMLSRRWAWIVSLTLATTALFAALGVGFLGVPYAIISGSYMDWFLSVGTILFVSGGLVLFLLLGSCRGWCDR
jgi:hypothetical protein